MFASSAVTDVDVGGVRVTIRRLSYAALERAREVRRRKALELLSQLERLPSLGSGVAPAEPDPVEEVDWQTVLEAGVVSWSDPRPVTPEALADLDPAAARLLVRSILDHSLRSPDEVKASASASPPISVPVGDGGLQS